MTDHQLQAWREDQFALAKWHRLARVRGLEILRQRREIEELRRRVAELEGARLPVAALRERC